MEKDVHTMTSALTLSQRVAICFAAGVVGALAVVLSSNVLSLLGLGVEGPIHFPVALKSPGIYLPLFWAGYGASHSVFL